MLPWHRLIPLFPVGTGEVPGEGRALSKHKKNFGGSFQVRSVAWFWCGELRFLLHLVLCSQGRESREAGHGFERGR